MPRRPPPRRSRVQDQHRVRTPVRVCDAPSRLVIGVQLHDGGHNHVFRVDDMHKRNGEPFVKLSNPVTEEDLGWFPVNPVSSTEGGAGELFYVGRAAPA